MTKTARAVRAKKAGLAPGTPIYTGEPRNRPIRIQVFDYTAERVDEHDGVPVPDCARFAASDTTTWINVDGVHDPTVVQQVCEMFKIHPLSVEDILHIGTRPKCEEYDHYFFIVLEMLNLKTLADGTLEIEPEQVSLVFGQGFVLTFQEEPGDVWDPVRKRLRAEGGRLRRLGSDYLGYSLLDAVVDHYLVVLDEIGEQVEDLEEQALESVEGTDVVAHIHDLKRKLLMLRRSVWPLREVTGVLMRTDTDLIKANTHPFLRDLHDHVIQAIETTEIYRESAVALLELYLAGTSNRLNQVMKVLTVLTAVFIPITFIAGVYGMNFRFMPELEWRYGYFWALGMMAATAVGMILYFRRNNWL